MKTITPHLFEFDELSASAKEKAREWYRNGALDYEWWEGIYEDAANVGLKITGFELDRSRHATGEFTMPASHVAEKILADHGADCETHKTALAFVNDCKALDARTEKDDDGVPLDEESYNEAQDEQDDEFIKSLLENYSIMLQEERAYIMSDEQVDKSIKANQYTFTVDGKRHN